MNDGITGLPTHAFILPLECIMFIYFYKFSFLRMNSFPSPSISRPSITHFLDFLLCLLAIFLGLKFVILKKENRLRAF
jgi:hypothetical protein